jgi:glycosyltransferase involved in cell wall biosynthesis
LRIGFAVYGDLSNRSGGYLYDSRLAERLEANGHRIVLLSLHPVDSLEEGHPESFELARTFEERGIDIILEDELAHPSLIVPNNLLRGSKPILSIVHNLSCQVAMSVSGRRIHAKSEREYLSSVDGFIFNSQATRSAVERLLGHPVRSCVAPPGKDHLRSGDVVSRDFDENVLNVIYIGNLLPYKGLDILIEALSNLERGRYKVWAVGAPMDPDFAMRMKALVRKKRLDGEVSFLGRVDEGRLVKLLEAAHVLALPSLHEGYGLVYVEAMGFGLPVLASSSGGAKEFVDDGVQGFLIPPADHVNLAGRLKELYDDRRLLKRMSRNARSRYDQLPTWSESMNQAVRFIETFQ